MPTCTARDRTNMVAIRDSYHAARQRNQSLSQTLQVQNNAKRIDAAAGKFSLLTQQKADLIASIEQHERDFVDLRDALPEVLPSTSVHILDDYTLWMLVLSYSLFMVSVIFYYCYINSYTPTSILVSTVGAGLVTIFLFILMILLL